MKTSNQLMYICQKLKIIYGVHEVRIVKFVKESEKSFCFEAYFDLLHSFVKLSKSKSLIYENEDLYKCVCAEINSLIPILTAQGFLFSTILDYRVTVFKWIEIEHFMVCMDANRYFKFTCDISERLSSININEFIDFSDEKMFMRRIKSAFLVPNFFYEYVGYKVLMEYSIKIKEISDYYLKNINDIKKKISQYNRICIIHNDINITNVVMVQKKLLLIDFDSIGFGLPMQPIYIIAMNLLCYEDVFDKYLFYISKLGYSKKEILLGCIFQINQLLRYIESNKTSDSNFNRRYFGQIIDALYYYVLKERK